MSGISNMRCPACQEPILRTDDRCLGCGAHLDEGQLVGSPAGQCAPETPAPAAAPDTLEVDLEPEPRQPRPAPPPAAVPRPRPAPASVAHIPTGGGLGAGLARAWVFLGQSLALARENPVVALPSLFSVLAGLALVGAYLLVCLAVGGKAVFEGEEGRPLTVALQWIGYALAPLAWLITYWFMGMTADLVSAILRGGTPSLRHAWGEACRNAGALVALAFVTTVVRALTGSLRRRGGVLGDMAADVVDRSWEVATYLLVPIIILEDTSFGEATQRGLHLHRHNVIGIVVGEIAVGWLTGFISGLLVLAAVGVGYLAYQATPVLLPMVIAAVVSWLVIISAASGYVRMAYYTCLYEWAVASETAAAPVAAPAPLAAALARA